MADFSATDAALEGLRLTREKPKAVVIWAALLLVLSLATTFLIISMAGEAFTSLMGAGGGRNTDPEQALAALRELGPLYLVLLPVSLLAYSVLYAAIYRAVLRPQEGGAGYLKLGADELRLAGALVLVVLVLFGLTLGAVLVLTVILGALGAGGGAGGAVAAVALIPLLLLAVIAFFGVKLSLALPATFAERRIRVFESWRLTKGRFWPLLGCYVLAIILALVVYLLAMMIYLALAALVAGGVSGATSAFQPDYASVSGFFSPAMMLYMLVLAPVSAVTTAITTAPAAAAYRDITGYGRDTAEVFS